MKRAVDHHFATGHLIDDLKGRSVRGGAITLSAQGIKFVLQVGSTMVLARLLTPADFGLIAMVTVVTGFVAMFKDAGLSVATIQREHITHEQVSTLFWINVSLSIAVMIVVAALAPAIAWFYGKPELTWITLALAATFIFSGLTVQHQALLRRQMRFKALAIIDIASLAAGIATAIVMAVLGFGYWSLVGMPAAMAVVNCVLVWVFSGWQPGRPVRGSGVRSMLGFGGGLTGFNVLNYFTRNADNVIIGFALGSGPLGLYSRAYNLLMLPIRQINVPVSAVMLPLLSRLQSDSIRYRRAYMNAIGMLAFVGMPLVAFLFVIADDAVLIVLGPGWEEASTVFRWLAPAALLGTVNVAPGWLCNSLGRVKTQLIWAALSAPIAIMAFLVGTNWGIVGVAAAFSVTWCILLLVFMAMACHRTPIAFTQLLVLLAHPVFASTGAAAVCLALVPELVSGDLPLVMRVSMNAILFSLFYFALTCVTPAGRYRIRSLWSNGLLVLGNRSQEVGA